MATKKVFISKDGSPATGLFPDWEYLEKVSDSSAVVGPTISEIGGGWYKYTIALDDSLVGVIDAGFSVDAFSERYLPVEVDIHENITEVLVTPVYNEDIDSLQFLVFMLQDGIRVVSPTSCVVTVYDSSHVEKFSINGSVSQNGVFVLSKSSPALVANNLYYAVASVINEGTTYTSIDTYISLE